ncbi:hypothetical protein PPL19_03930 [Pseudomonas psychrotolerans L19]|uniref:hypothetical protein n=1 Tax=Pseudomonas oryzihabitans TaxID=47885 RepID=UPI00023A50B9|nr:hypothetical protein [Pseudomonas psychrotolerans]EHK72057.1 hypothetical protein PPL19_03930 [Pseudomonas psychrotolerans L19]
MALTLDDLEMIQERLKDSTEFPAAYTLEKAFASVWIASGLAKISAAYGAALVEGCVGFPSQLMSAMDYCQKNLLRRLPVLVSLKGQHEDAVGVAQSIVNRLSPASVLITGEPEGLAAQTLSAGLSAPCIVSASFPSRDRRFVNCGSIFMLSALAYQLVRQAFGSDMIGRIDEYDLAQAFTKAAGGAQAIAQGIAAVENWQHKQLVVLGQGLGSELTLPWQSIFAEAGIATATCLDLKDYTHGDHMAAVRANNIIFLVIQHSGTEEMVRIFTSRFATRFPVLVAPLASSGPTRFWENLFYCCNTADDLTHRLGYGGQRPPKDPAVHSWRGWGSLG